MIRYFGVGSAKVVRGGTVRVLALVEYASGDVRSFRRLIPIVKLVGENFQQDLILSLQTTLEDTPGVEVSSFIASIDTSDLPPGGYELELKVDRDEVSLDEALWILEEEDYIKLLQEELPLTDLSDQSNSSLDAQDVNPQLVQRLVHTAVHEKLQGFLRLGYKLAVIPVVEVSYEGAPGSSLNLVGYLAEVFADQCRSVLIHGVDSYALRVTLAPQLLQFSLSAQLDSYTSVPEADFPSFDLRFLQNLFNESHAKLQLNVAANVAQGHASLAFAMRRPYHSVAQG